MPEELKRRLHLYVRAQLVLFIFVVIFFTYLSWRMENGAENFRNEVYAQCLARNVNTHRINLFYSTMADIERTTPFVTSSPETVESRVKAYESQHLEIVFCKQP